MFYQVIYSPKKNLAESNNKLNSEDSAILILAPFTDNTKICFENVVRGYTATKRLLIKNPSKKEVKLSLSKYPPEEKGFSYSWLANVIQAEASLQLEINWNPKETGAFHDLITFQYGSKFKKDVHLIFKSTSPKKQLRKTKLNRISFDSNNRKKAKKEVGQSRQNEVSLNKNDIVFSTPSVPTLTKQTYKLISHKKCLPIIENEDYIKLQNLPFTPIIKQSISNISKRCSLGLPERTHTSKRNSLPKQAFLNTAVRKIDFGEPKYQEQPKNRTYIKTRLSIKKINDKSHIGNNKVDKGKKNISKTVVSEQTYILSNRKGKVSDKTYIKKEAAARGSDYSNKLRVNNKTVKHKEILRVIKQKSVVNMCDLPCEQLKMTQGITYERNLTELRSSQEFFFNDNTCSFIEEEVASSCLIPISTTDCNINSRNELASIKESYNNNTYETSQNRKKRKIWPVGDEFEIKKNKRDNNPDYKITDLIRYNWTSAEEISIKKQVNQLLLPPPQFSSDTKPLNIDNLLHKYKTHNNIKAAVNNEIKNSDVTLNNIRKKAVALFRSPELFKAISKTITLVENGKLAIAPDKNIHVDINAQQQIITLLLNYNPIWLRIGLETIFERNISLRSNSDVRGISDFIMKNLFKDFHLQCKYKSVQSSDYNKEIKRHILRKFLMLVYFLDCAKLHKLIPYDPCLFRKDAGFKENRELLLIFSKKFLVSNRDVIKSLNKIGFTVSHKQAYIHEFNYGVENISTDFKDGIRLAKLVGIILLKVSEESLRAPAISRLQKIHNVRVALDTLLKSRCLISDINPKDIVDGNREKTLSLLNFMLNFRSVKMNQSAVIIQRWWRNFKEVL